MMEGRKIFDQFNIAKQCRHYDLPLWQCPQFLFLIMGIIIIGTILITYFLGNRYIEEPTIVVLIILAIAAILFIIGFIIVQGFEKLADANRLKGEFISVVSHQLRAPLSNIRWAIELLIEEKEGKAEGDQFEYFSIVKENTERMKELISDLLTVSRIQTTGLLIKKEEISLEDLVQKLIREFEPFANASNVKIIFNPQENLPKIFTDPSQLKIVIENFLDNAIRYVYPLKKDDKEKGLVEIRVFQKKRNLFCEVKDNGVGIPTEDQKYIFQKFFRSKNIMKYQTQGTGLGLYISKAIIERLGGKIGFRSQEGQGSTFWFLLPIK